VIDRKGQMMLSCVTHGTHPWGGAVVCPTCRTTYQTHDENAERYAPEMCCGRRFMPPKTGNRNNFSANPICNACALKTGLALPKDVTN
jgi:hypothetical protein